MNKRLYIFALLLSFVMAAFAQSTEEQKKLINSIKKSKSYLYAEITTTDQQTASDLAEEMLNQEINKYIAEQKKLRSAANIVLRNRAEVMESISMPRGNMFRAFKYVKKDDIIPADKVEVRSNQGITVDDNGNRVAMTTPASGTSNRSETIKQLLAITKTTELAKAMPKMKQEGRISHFAKIKELDDRTQYVLVICNREGNVEAVLSEGASRTNLRTGQPDSESNYPGRAAFGLKVNN